jgi:hypothetical protein
MRKLADAEKEMPQATPDVTQNVMIQINQEGGQNSEDRNVAIKYHGNDDHVETSHHRGMSDDI